MDCIRCHRVPLCHLVFSICQHYLTAYAAWQLHSSVVTYQLQHDQTFLFLRRVWLARLAVYNSGIFTDKLGTWSCWSWLLGLPTYSHVTACPDILVYFLRICQYMWRRSSSNYMRATPTMSEVSFKSYAFLRTSLLMVYKCQLSILLLEQLLLSFSADGKSSM